MFSTDPQNLAWVLENLVEGHVVNQISVSENDSKLAKEALNEMLELV